MTKTMIPTVSFHSFHGAILLLAFASEAFCLASSSPPQASGVVTNTAAWFDAADASRVAREFGDGYHVDGHLFFGG